MSQNYRLRGFGLKEALLALIVIVVVAAILIPTYVRQRDKTLLLDEGERMRRVYIALSFYEEQYDSQPAPSLVAASLYDPNHADFLSAMDPFSKGPMDSSQSPKFPGDPGLDNNEYSSFRMSFSYLMNFVRANKLQIKPWVDTRQDPTIGELANEWLGSVQPGEKFKAQVGGRVLRVCTDGHVTLLKDRGGPKPLGDANDLFVRQ